MPLPASYFSPLALSFDYFPLPCSPLCLSVCLLAPSPACTLSSPSSPLLSSWLRCPARWVCWLLSCSPRLAPSPWLLLCPPASVGSAVPLTLSFPLLPSPFPPLSPPLSLVLTSMGTLTATSILNDFYEITIISNMILFDSKRALSLPVLGGNGQPHEF